MAKLVSKTYGDALFELAMEADHLDEMWSEVKEVDQIIRKNNDLAKLMNHPKIVKEEKIKILENIFQDRISMELLGLMRMLVSKNHYEDMESVFEYFTAQVKEYKNIGTAHVVSALPLNVLQEGQIKSKLLQTTKYVEFDITYSVDKELIGGMVIRIGDRVVDSSIKTKLSQLSRELSKIQLKVGECAP